MKSTRLNIFTQWCTVAAAAGITGATPALIITVGGAARVSSYTIEGNVLTIITGGIRSTWERVQ